MPEPVPPAKIESPARVAVGGFLMGLANLVPGVSGGTMILALGLYDRFIVAVADVTRLRLRPSSLLFLGIIVFCAAIAIIALSGFAVQLVTDYRWVMYSLFIGMTLGGAPGLVGQCRPVKPGVVVSFVVGLGLMALLAWGLSRSRIEPSAPVLALVGALAASSMILPGVSGSYILLIFGLYDVVLGAVSSLKSDPFESESIRILVPVAVGAALGIALLSNLLRFVLGRFPAASHAMLLGLLVGSVLGLWPFREPVHPDLADKAARKGVAMLVAGESLEAVNAEHELGWDEARAAVLREQYAGQSAGDLKAMGDELEPFRPAGSQVGIALGLFALGFLITRTLGRKESPAPPGR